MSKVLLSSLCFFISVFSFAADIFVDLSAPAGGDGSSWATAFQDIQSAVDVALADDTIFIAEGIYQPQNTIDINFSLNIRGGYPEGGGVQDINTNITQIQADFDTSTLLNLIFNINPNAETQLTGIRFFNCVSAIRSQSNLYINQVEFEQFTGNAIQLRGTIDTCQIDTSFFSNFTQDMIGGSSLTLINFNVTNSIFQNGDNRLVYFGDDVSNFSMVNCIVQNFDNTTNTIDLDTSTATFTNLQVENNVSTSGAIIFFRDSDVTIEQSLFNDNSIAGIACLQGMDSQLDLINTNFTNNDASGSFPQPAMKMNDVALTATNCLFQNNNADGSQAHAVAEIRADDTNAVITFENCVFIGNTATGSNADILNISYGSSPFINNCLFDGNSAIGIAPTTSFNAINSFGSTGAVITNTTFKNHTEEGRLINLANSTGYDIVFENNTIIDNNFTQIRVNRFDALTMKNNIYSGGDIDFDMYGIPDLTITNDFFKGNASGNPFFSFIDLTAKITNTQIISEAINTTHTLTDSGNNSALEITNSTFTATDINNTNVRIEFDDDIPSFIQNSIIWSGNNNLAQSGLTGSTTNLTINHSLVKGNSDTTNGNLDGTDAANIPEFVNPTALDFRIQNCAPTVNAGLNSAVTETVDFIGNPRIVETTVDLGAFESQSTACTPAEAPLCTSLIGPGPVGTDTDVVVNTDLFWELEPNAIGYILQVGTTSGGTDLVNETLGAVTTYNVFDDLPDGDEIFVTITPFNGVGNALGCASESFTTTGAATTPTAPTCTALSSPMDSATDIAVNLNEITWDMASNTTQYRITVDGSTSDVNDVTDLLVTGTSHPFTNNFDNSETVTVTIVPLNGTEEPVTPCTSESFTIVDALPLSNEYYVDLSAPAGGNGLSWATAFQDIASAVAIASPNATIFIAEGIYRPNATQDILVPLTIKGGYPAGGGAQNIPTNTTQIQGDFFGPGFELNIIFSVFSPFSLEGVRFLNTITTISSNADLTINQVGFDQTENTSIFLNNSAQNLTINDATFENGTGKAVFVPNSTTANVQINNTAIRGFNTDENLIHISSPSSPDITNLLVENNTLSTALLIFYSNETGTLTIENSTFRDNIINSSGAGMQLTEGSLILENTDFLNNSANGANAYPIMNLTRSNITATNCNFIGNSSIGANTIISVQDFGEDITTNFDNCVFRNNSENGSLSSTRLLDINNAMVSITNSTFDGNGLRCDLEVKGGATITNNEFFNYDASTRNILYVLGDATSGIVFQENQFFNNIKSEINITRFINLISQNNSYIGDTELSARNIDNAMFVNDYFQGNANTSSTQFLVLNEITAKLENILMISEKAAGTSHKLIESENNTALQIINSTFSGTNTQNINIDFDDDLPSTIQNSIIWAGSTNPLTGGITNLSIDHSLLQGQNPTGTGNLDGTDLANAPKFVDPTILDFRTLDCSPTINVGLNANTSTTTDFSGNSRIFETTIDLGAYELQVPTSIICTPPTPPNCTTLDSPANGDTAVAIDLNEITWTNVANATQYRIGINGSTSDLNDETDLLVTGTSHSFSNNFDNGETVTVTIVPLNGTVEPTATCTTETFTIVSAATPTSPSCTSLNTPENNDTNIAVNIAQISWDAVADATQYRISINGSTSDLNDETDLLVTGTSHSFSNNFDNGETVTVTIVPLNGTVEPTATCTTETFTIVSAVTTTPPSCTTLSSPENNDTNIAVDIAQISWDAAADATQYRISINGSTSDLNDETDLLVTGTSHSFSNNFDNGETVTVTIVPLNGTVEPTATCTTETFTIVSAVTTTPPSCTTLSSPENNDTNIAVDIAQISWNAATDATQYRISINGSTSDLNDETDLLVTGTSHSFSNNFDNGETVTVTIVPLNGTVEPTATCTTETFTIEEADVIPMIPDCSQLITPANGSDSASVDSILEWQPVANADGYQIIVGTVSGGNDILDEDVGILTSYTLPDPLNADLTYYVNIIPYNAAGNQTTCIEQIFTTAEEEEQEEEEEEIESLYGFSPDGDGINEFWEITGIEAYPENTVIIFNRWGDAIFQISGYDNNTNVFRGEANLKTQMGAGLLPSGTYFFNIQIPVPHNLKKTKGFLVLKR